MPAALKTIDTAVTWNADHPDPLAAGNCLVAIDASDIRDDTIRHPPHYLKKAVEDHCRSIIRHAAVLNSTVFIVAKSEDSKKAITEFAEGLLAKLRQPATRLIRCMITNTDLVHSDTLRALLSQFGKVHQLLMSGKAQWTVPPEDKTAAEAVYGSCAHAELTLPISTALPGKIALSVANETVIMRITPPPQQRQPQPIEACRDYQRGVCKRPACRYSHAWREIPRCRDFQAGRCLRKAGTCKFSHAPPQASQGHPPPRSGPASPSSLPAPAASPLRPPGTESLPRPSPIPSGPPPPATAPGPRRVEGCPPIHSSRAARIARPPGLAAAAPAAGTEGEDAATSDAETKGAAASVSAQAPNPERAAPATPAAAEDARAVAAESAQRLSAAADGAAPTKPVRVPPTPAEPKLATSVMTSLPVPTHAPESASPDFAARRSAAADAGRAAVDEPAEPGVSALRAQPERVGVCGPSEARPPAASRRTSRSSSPTPTKSTDLAVALSRQ